MLKLNQIDLEKRLAEIIFDSNKQQFKNMIFININEFKQLNDEQQIEQLSILNELSKECKIKLSGEIPTDWKNLEQTIKRLA